MKTKIIITAMFFYSLAYSAFAQTDKKEYDFGLSVAINSIQGQLAIPLMINGGVVAIDADGNIIAAGNRDDHSISYSVLPKYYINDEILLRFEFGITNLNLNADYYGKSGTAETIYNTEITNKIYRYTPGFQWTFMRRKKIESYCGLTVAYLNYKSFNRHWYAEYKDQTTNYSNDVTEITPGGFGIGVGALAGFSIYLHKRIAFGAELSSSALYYKLGGETTLDDTQFNISGPNPAITYHMTYTNSYNGFKISKIISSFNLTFWI